MFDVCFITAGETFEFAFIWFCNCIKLSIFKFRKCWTQALAKSFTTFMCVQRKELDSFPINGDQRGAINWLSLQSHSSPEGGAVNAWFDSALVLSPGFRHQVGFSFLQTSPLCCLLLFGELPAYFLADHLLQDTQKATTDEGKFCPSVIFASKFWHCEDTVAEHVQMAHLSCSMLTTWVDLCPLHSNTLSSYKPDPYRWNGGTTCYAVRCDLAVWPRPPVFCYVLKAVWVSARKKQTNRKVTEIDPKEKLQLKMELFEQFLYLNGLNSLLEAERSSNSGQSSSASFNSSLWSFPVSSTLSAICVIAGSSSSSPSLSLSSSCVSAFKSLTFRPSNSRIAWLYSSVSKLSSSSFSLSPPKCSAWSSSSSSSSSSSPSGPAGCSKAPSLSRSLLKPLAETSTSRE